MKNLKNLKKITMAIATGIIFLGTTHVMANEQIIRTSTNPSTYQTFTRAEFIRGWGSYDFVYNGNLYTAGKFFDTHSGENQGVGHFVNLGFQRLILDGVEVRIPQYVRAVDGVIQTAEEDVIQTVPTTQSVQPVIPVAPQIYPTAVTVSETEQEHAVVPVLFDEPTLLTSQELSALAETAPTHLETRSATILPNRRLTDQELQDWIAEYEELGGINTFELEVIRLVNEVRISYGLQPLAISQELSMAARFHSQSMVDNDYFSHDSLITGLPSNRAGMFNHRNLDRGGWQAFENVSGRIGYPEVVVTGWLNSYGHRNAILNASFRTLGLGFVSNNELHRTRTTLKFGQ